MEECIVSSLMEECIVSYLTEGCIISNDGMHIIISNGGMYGIISKDGMHIIISNGCPVIKGYLIMEGCPIMEGYPAMEGCPVMDRPVQRAAVARSDPKLVRATSRSTISACATSPACRIATTSLRCPPTSPPTFTSPSTSTTGKAPNR